MKSFDPEAKKAFALQVVETLKRGGHQALWAGGCVRDLMLGLVPEDYDIATDAPPERVMQLFRRTIPVGVSFGVVRVLGPVPAGEVEVATFRSDLAYVDGRRPEGVVFGSPELDASRRDFTINGMFLDPVSGDVLDYVGGMADLRERVLRAIGDPTARFNEDKLRLLRAVRFAARFDLRIDPATRVALESMSPQVVIVAPERIAQELRKMLVDESRARALQLALEVGLIGAILPSLALLRGLAVDSSRTDAWQYLLRVLDRLPAKTSATLATAALLHLVGLPRLRSEEREPSKLSSHPEVSSRMADAICRELRFSNAERERVTWLIAHQSSLGDAEMMPRARLKKLLASPGIEELLLLHRAIADVNNCSSTHVEYCFHYMRDQPEGPINPPPLLTGDDLKWHGLAPGPQFKTILEKVRDAQLEGLLSTREEALRWVDERISSNRPDDSSGGSVET